MSTKMTLTRLSIASMIAGAAMASAIAAGLPESINVPAGHKPVLETNAIGLITYECRAKKDVADQFEWVFAGPVADLTDKAGKPAGRYFGPPATWMSTDGSAVTGAQLAVAPNGAGNIPFQLVKANPATGAGSMQGVTYVQRLNTKAGVAPSSNCWKDSVGKKETVAYQADYVFWKAE